MSDIQALVVEELSKDRYGVRVLQRNLRDRVEAPTQFNLFWVSLDFEADAALLEFYCEDRRFPAETLSLARFAELLRRIKFNSGQQPKRLE